MLLITADTEGARFDALDGGISKSDTYIQASYKVVMRTVRMIAVMGDVTFGGVLVFAVGE